MVLKNCLLSELPNRIKSSNKKIIIYGAGMIGKVLVPYFIKEYELYDYVDCYIDADVNKIGTVIEIDSRRYSVKAPDYLNNADKNVVIIITNSKFIPIVDFFEGISALKTSDVYIYPIMQLNESNIENDFEIKKLCEKQLIPKTIHYCWFGRNPMPQFLQKCIASWREFCPDYEIVEWNEDNYDVSRHRYTEQAYGKKRFGFVTDIARFDILYENGGIYLDTDVMLLKNPDALLYQNGFIATEKWGNINSGGGCGFEKGNPMIKEIIDYRDEFDFINMDGSLNIETNGVYETTMFIKYGFIPDSTYQIVNGISVYPPCVFHPYDYMSSELSTSKSTVSVHHFYGGWMTDDDKLNRKKTQREYVNVISKMKN